MCYRFISYVLTVVMLTSCATTHYGNFATAPIGVDQRMANDTASQLITLYPPALTHLNVEQRVTDHYGMALVRVLRTKGYSVSELSSHARSKTLLNPQTKPITVHYLVDKLDKLVKETHYRVTIRLDDQSISRVYTVQHDQINPLGSWVHQESLL